MIQTVIADSEYFRRGSSLETLRQLHQRQDPSFTPTTPRLHSITRQFLRPVTQRRRLRLPRQGAPRKPDLVSRHRLGDLLVSPDLRSQRRQPAPPRLRIWVQRSGLRLPVRRLPFYHGRIVRRPRPESELGLHDARPRHIGQHLQPLVRLRPRRALGRRGRREETLRGGHRVLPVRLRRDPLVVWAGSWRHALGYLAPGENASERNGERACE